MLHIYGNDVLKINQLVLNQDNVNKKRSYSNNYQLYHQDIVQNNCNVRRMHIICIDGS